MSETPDKPAHNETARVEAFRDGVFAIAITLLVLEIRVRATAEHAGLRNALTHLWPSYLAFLASFMTIGVMWLNAASFLGIAIVFNLMWRYAVRAQLVVDHLNVGAITRQHLLGPIMYAVLVGVAVLSGLACLVVSALYALYFVLPARLWAKSQPAKAT